MKNKKSIKNFLLFLIFVLIAMAGFYTASKADIIFDVNQKYSSGEVGKNDNKANESMSSMKDPIISSDDLDGEENSGNDTSIDPDDSSSENGRFKKITSYKDFYSYISRKNQNMYIVFGREGCYFCDKFVPILTEVANEYRVEILYVDMVYLSEEDYTQIIDSSLVIPAKCTKSGEEALLKDGFGTPLSLFINNGQTYSCIRGYKDKTSLISLLKNDKYI